MKQQKQKIIIAAVIAILLIGFATYFAKESKKIKNQKLQEQQRNIVDQNVKQTEENNDNTAVQIQSDSPSVSDLLPNELIAPEEAVKLIAQINEKVKSGEIKKEDGDKQIALIGKHLAPPTQK